jgi:hypothetical protein
VGPCAGGCASLPPWLPERWIADYDRAEQRSRDSDRDLLIWFTDSAPGTPDPLQAVFANKQVRQKARGYVRCQLVKSHEPDRRYVAQFGVQRAPAVIIVHRDGTYHTQAGAPSAEEVLQFLGGGKPPGLSPSANPLVPRRARYIWHENVAAAQREAETHDAPVLIVYHRRFSGDWRALKKLLYRHEVYRRFAGMIHCRVATWNPWGQAADTPFGTVRLPALVVVDAHGDHHVLEIPTSYEAIVRFGDRLAQPDPGPKASTATVFVSP